MSEIDRALDALPKFEMREAGSVISMLGRIDAIMEIAAGRAPVIHSIALVAI